MKWFLPRSIDRIRRWWGLGLRAQVPFEQRQENSQRNTDTKCDAPQQKRHWILDLAHRKREYITLVRNSFIQTRYVLFLKSRQYHLSMVSSARQWESLHCRKIYSSCSVVDSVM